MKADSRALRVIERGLLLFGSLLIVAFALARIHRSMMFRSEMTRFEARRLEPAREPDVGKEFVRDQSHIGSFDQKWNTVYSLWSAQRIKLYQASFGESAQALAVLRIPKLRLEVPVLEGTDEFTLNRGVGRIAGTAHPGQGGNVGIAGHRDGFFRPLKDISPGDSIELITTAGKDVYAVDRVRITSPGDVSVLQSRAKPSLTLVTCYPFYFVGPAPRRYIVEASLKQEVAQDEVLDGNVIFKRRNQ